MNCQQIATYLNRYVDGELSGRRQRLIAAHLATCDNCRVAVASLKRIEEALLSEPMDKLPGDLSGEVVQEAQSSLDSFQLEAEKSGKVQIALPENVDPKSGAEQPKKKIYEKGKAKAEPLRTVGPYNVYECIGKGAMGKVYKAFDPALNRPVAIKEIRPEIGRNEKLIKRFLREARLVARLHHENICSLYFLGTNEDSGLPYIAMEFIDGVTLEHVIHHDGPLPPMRAIEVIRQVAIALKEALRHEVIHRDVKPANIMLGRGGRVKVTDFGLAKALDVDSDLTSPNSLVGTPHYLAPEAGTATKADHLSDIYALGVSLYFTITGKLPYDGPNALVVFDKQRKSPVPDVREVMPNVSPVVAKLILRMMAKDRNERPSNYESLITELDNILSGVGSGETTSIPLPNVFTKGLDKELFHRLALSSFVVIVLLAALFHILYLPEEPTAKFGEVVQRVSQTPTKAPPPTKIPARRTVVRKPTLLMLGFSSDPADCLVELVDTDGSRTVVGRTHRPFTARYKKGRYRFAFSKSGYVEKIIDVQLAAGVSDVRANLVKAVGTLQIDLQPPDAIITVNGVDLRDRSKISGMELVAGTYRVGARLFGFEKQEESVDIKAGKTTRLVLHLKRVYVPFSSNTQLQGSQTNLRSYIPPLLIKVVSIAGSPAYYTAAITYRSRDYLVEKGWRPPDLRFEITHIDEDKVIVKDLLASGQPHKTFYF